MSKHSFATKLATLFIAVISVTLSVSFIGPSKAYAVDPVSVPTQDWLTQLETTITAIATPVTAVSTAASWLNQNILQPIAFIKSGALLKVLTSSIVGFVTGKANGTGAPQFTVNLMKTMQTLSDAKNKAFIAQMVLTGSPFSSSISAALTRNYLQGSSLAGFWAANTCTLSKSSPNVRAYLAGNWSQGGATSWFALTTQSQNNPYMLFLKGQAQLANVVADATQSRLSELNWGKGFMSWCGVSDTATQTAAAAQAAMESCINTPGNTPAYCDKVFADAGGAVGGINPGDACTNSDGTTGTIKTPGSVITDGLTKAFSVGPDKLVQMGNIGTQLGGILGSIANVMGTINLAKDILSGPSNGGLLGSSNSAVLNDTAATASALGVIDKAAAGMASASGMSERLPMYKTAWDTISTAANTASTNVNALISTCTSNSANAATQITALQRSTDPTAPDQITQLQGFISAASAQTSAAQTVLTQKIAPVFAQVTSAASITAAATAMLQKANPTAEDIQKLNSMPPTGTDAATAQKDAAVTGVSKANPSGSLTVSGGTTVDQMNLISSNAVTLASTVCTLSSPVP